MNDWKKTLAEGFRGGPPPAFSAVAMARFDAPRNYGELDEPDGHARITGPCGDTMEFWVQVEEGRVSAASFTTTGCGPSRACGSMATELAEGRPVADAARIGQQDVLDALGGLPPDHEHCALLASNTLQAALASVRASAAGAAGAGTREYGESCGSCTSEDCGGGAPRAGESHAECRERQALRNRLSRIRHKVVVLSGKGGVGKSTVAVNLAVALMMSGKEVGLLDVDIHGPSIPAMLGLEGENVETHEGELLPVELGGLKVMSIGFLLRHPDDALIWRGPMKMGVIQQFLKDTAWGDLDFLIIDSPPGTGDEPLSVCQLIEGLDGAVVVTTPQKVAAIDVRKSIAFCRQLNVPVIGVVENMSGFVCPHCGEVTQVLREGGGRRIADDMNVPFLGAIPLDPRVAEACDVGRPFIHHESNSPTAEIMRAIIAPIAALDKGTTPETTESPIMRFAIPLAGDKLALHFGHCERFALIDADPENGTILQRHDIDAPPHQPGLLPPWLANQGVNRIIAGGMGQRAKDLFVQQGIVVIVGAPADTPERLVAASLGGTLEVGENACDH